MQLRERFFIPGAKTLDRHNSPRPATFCVMAGPDRLIAKAAMVRRNAENAVQAASLVTDVAGQVNDSNAALNEMVGSMAAIRESSNKVAKIIKTIDEIAFQTNILALNAAVEAARADLRWAARDRSDKEALAARNIVSQSALDQARATAEQKTSLVSMAEAQLEVARKNLADADVLAPFDGVVGERIANQGESLPIDGKILALLDTSHVEVAAQMPAADVVRMKVGQQALVTLEGFGERGFEAKVTRISPTAQPGSRSILVYVEILDRHEGLRGGLFAQGTINVQEKSHALAVPVAAMRKDDQGDFVLAVENGQLVRKPVGAVRTWSRGELVEVKGLEAGLRIVSAPLPGLKAGQRVKVIETP